MHACCASRVTCGPRPLRGLRVLGTWCSHEVSRVAVITECGAALQSRFRIPSPAPRNLSASESSRGERRRRGAVALRAPLDACVLRVEGDLRSSPASRAGALLGHVHDLLTAGLRAPDQNPVPIPEHVGFRATPPKRTKARRPKPRGEPQECHRVVPRVQLAKAFKEERHLLRSERVRLFLGVRDPIRRIEIGHVFRRQVREVNLRLAARMMTRKIALGVRPSQQSIAVDRKLQRHTSP